MQRSGSVSGFIDVKTNEMIVSEEKESCYGKEISGDMV